jgi:hypothetical protein
VVWAVTIALCAAYLACDGKPERPVQPTAEEYGAAEVAVPIPKLLVSTLARVEALVTASDIDTIRKDLTIGEDDVARGVITGILVGDERKVTLNGYAHTGVLTHSGCADGLTIVAGDTLTNVVVVLFPITGSVNVNGVIGETNGGSNAVSIGPADPPYASWVVYPSGLKLDNLVQDPALTQTFPDPDSNPWGMPKAVHYQRVGYFIDIDAVDCERRVSENFRLREYTDPPRDHGDPEAYVDAQIVDHVQQIRTGVNRPLLVNSSFRGPEYNAAIAGAPYSRHQYGDAIDIDVDQSLANHTALAQELYNMAELVGVDYIEPLPDTQYSWVHVDDRGFRP